MIQLLKTSAVTLLLASLSSPAFSASHYSVKGNVCDSVGNPESFATVRIYLLPDSVKPRTSGVTDDNGIFNIPLSTEGKYRINVSSFGNKEIIRDTEVSETSPVADLGTLLLSPQSSSLQELVVTAQRPLITKEIDRIGYDVQADEEAKTSQLDEILKKVPLVSVDPDGTIKVKGSTDFKIYKNGRPNNSFSRNAKDIFKALPASMIKKIEVITDPGSREDAEGTTAILNIVTMENTVIKGVMGNVGLNYSRYDKFPTPNLWLSTQIDKLNVSLYGGYNTISPKQNSSRQKSYYKYEDSGNELTSESQGDNHGGIGFFGIDASLELDTLNLFSAEFSGYVYQITSRYNGHNYMLDAAGNTLYSYGTSLYNHPNRYFDMNGSFNYQRSTRRKGETLTLSYLISTTDQTQNSITEYENEVNMPVPYSGVSNDFKLNFIEHTGQFDWTRPINEANKFDVGVKYIHRNNHSINDIQYLNFRDEHSDFIHLTQVLALYFDYRLKWKKFGARAGLRYEYSHLSAKYKDGSNEPFGSSLNDWVPNVSFSYNINDANTVKLSYSTRINRPGISQLNPAVVESPTSISSGNPDLVSSRHQSVNLNYNLIGRKLSMDFSTSYSFINNGVISVRELLQNDITLSGYSNSGRNRWFNLALWLNYSPGNKTRIMLNANANYAYTSDPTRNLKETGWGGNAYISIRQDLPWGINLNLWGNFFSSAPSIYSRQTVDFASNIFYGINLQRSFLKEKRLTVRAGINNPFGKSSRIFNSEPLNSGYTGYNRTESLNKANSFSLSVSYRFGSLNAQVKKTATSISNDDLEGRKN